jgi:cell wall-associated NlpC family hydrolase
MATKKTRPRMTETQPVSVLVPARKSKQTTTQSGRKQASGDLGNGRGMGNGSDTPNGEDMRRGGDMGEAGDMGDARDMPQSGDMTGAGDLRLARFMGRSRATNSKLERKADIKANLSSGTGAGVLALAADHIGEKYVLGARAPMANPNWKGPWDCAEFVSWCVYQHCGILFGTQPRNAPILADAYTGYWGEQAQQAGCTIPWQDAVAIPGAILLRRPSSTLTGHIVIVDGKGGTVEAHSTLRGVIAGPVDARRWDVGILVPGIAYFQSDIAPKSLAPPPFVLRVTQPLMRGELVRKVQGKLAHDGYPIGTVDGIYGPQTAHAVVLFQHTYGLLADGEVGPTTMAKLFPPAK